MHLPHSPLIGKAVKQDGQDEDEHGRPEADADQLLQLGQGASGLVDEEAAGAAVRGSAAADRTQGCERAFQR